MSLYGKAFIIMWHDIAAEGEQDYHAWHTRQHMPERLSHPGFLRSRRGMNWGADKQRYFTLYEGETLETFLSAEYAHSLNCPTDWTQRVAPHFRNFLRVACAIVHTSGRGVGGALASFRCALPPGIDESTMLKRMQPALADIADMPLVTAVHVAVARPDFSSQRTTETALRPPMNERPFDLVVVAESVGLMEVERDAGQITATLASTGLTDILTQCYDNAFTLERDN